MKVLLINGSLRGENSHSLMVARKFTEGICEETDSEVKEIYLGNTRIEHCRGCFGCWKVTPGRCVIKDDMFSIVFLRSIFTDEDTYGQTSSVEDAI